MATLPKSGPITWEEWLSMPQSDGREEVVNGYIVEMPPAKTPHMFVVENVVEVLSPSETRRMAAEKLRDYADIGVPEAWVVSPEAATVEVLQRDEEGRLGTTGIHREGLLRPTAFPQVAIDIAQIWPE